MIASAKKWQWCLLAMFGCTIGLGGVALSFRQTDAPQVIDRHDVRVATSGTVRPFLMSELAKDRRGHSVEYVIENFGQDNAQLEFLGTNCACIGLDIAGSRCKPGAVFEIGAGDRLHALLVFRPREAPGRYSLTAAFTVKARDEEFELPIEYRTSVYADAKATPASIVSERSNLDTERQEITIRLERYARSIAAFDADPSIVGLPASLELVRVAKKGQATVVESGVWMQEYVMDLSALDARQSSTLGRHEVSVLWGQPGDVSYASVRIPVLLQLSDGIRVPTLVHFGRVAKAQNTTKRFLVYSADKKRFRITGARIDADDFRVSVASTAPKSSHWVTVAATGENQGRRNGRLILNTDYPSASEVSLALLALVE